MGAGAPLFYDEPLHLVRGDGVWVYDGDGRRYLDCYNNVPHVGHCHPRVVAAIAEQAATLNIHTRYLDEQVLNYLDNLVATFDEALTTAILTCTGSEANEVALRMARHCTGHEGIVCTSCAYHGNTTAVWELATGIPGGGGSPRVRSFDAPDSYRPPAGVPAEQLGEHYAARVQAAIEALERAGYGCAALVVCTVFGSEGIPQLPPDFLERAAARVRAAGGLVIADEVQAGFGRSGTAMWQHQNFGLVPDIVTLGKPMGNGYPVAGTVARRELIDAFQRDQMYFNTFGGNAVAAAAGQAVLDVLDDEELLANAREVGEHARAGLRELMQRHAMIGDVRGYGLFMGVELVSDRREGTPAAGAARRVVNAMKDKGVLISKIGPHDNVLKLRPPMCFRREHAEQLVAALDDVLRALG